MFDQNIFSLKLGGQAGQGVKSIGQVFSKVATRSGYQIYTYTEYPSLIRGGHNAMQVCISRETVGAPVKRTDLLVALNQETINNHFHELVAGSGVLFDKDKNIDTSKLQPDVVLFPIPLAKLATEAGGKEILINTVATGATAAILGANLAIVTDLIADQFGHKGGEIIDTNNKAAELGYNFAKENFADKLKNILQPQENIIPKMIINGTEGVSLGAIAGGVQFASIYPMTPITNILAVLAEHQEEYNYIYKQPEDEISAINMAIGASYVGARAMTATSGGGFCLMTEGYGLAGMTETPVVIIEGMRVGPATGLPTWNEQGDLRFILHAHQGDFPRIVLAAGDAKEAFLLTMQAFNLAETYQTPVVVIVDKNLCEDDQSFEIFDVSSYSVTRGKFVTQKVDDYKRYALESDGISTRTIPGVGNYYITNSDEHDEYGFDEESSQNRIAQHEKRMNKLQTCANQDMQAPQFFGPEIAEVTIVSWGSNKGSILQAMKDLSDVNFLHIVWMNPFPTEAVKAVLSKAKRILSIECNYSAQLAGLITEKTGIEMTEKLLKYDGRPIYPEEIIEKVKSIL
jgi:2-oxoglutarate/2-oxoacid ferredoxin oxidoreductase subunit alpha